MKKRGRDEEEESKVEDTLPPHWIARKSRTHNKWFYYNSISGFKTWTHPSKLLEKEMLRHKEESEKRMLIDASTSQPKEKRRVLRHFSSPRQPAATPPRYSADASDSSTTNTADTSCNNQTSGNTTDVRVASIDATPTKAPPP